MSRCKFYTDYPLRISVGKSGVIHAAIDPFELTVLADILGRSIKRAKCTRFACGHIPFPWIHPVLMENAKVHKGNPPITCKNCLKALDGIEASDNLFAVRGPDKFFLDGDKPVDSLNKARLYRTESAILERYGNSVQNKLTSKFEYFLKPGYEIIQVQINQIGGRK